MTPDFGFFLKCMDYPRGRINSDNMTGAKSVPTIPRRDSKYAAFHASERFGFTGQRAFRGKCQSIEHGATRIFGKILKIPPPGG